jgi:ApaG protein
MLPENYTETTKDIRVTVVPTYLESQSSPEHYRYAFAYTVKIQNFGGDTVQLLRRHWIVMSGGSVFTEVKGDGVVGMQPILTKGDEYEYSSGSVIKDPVGSMHGTYTFATNAGKIFDVVIPKFDLMCPSALH